MRSLSSRPIKISFWAAFVCCGKSLYYGLLFWFGWYFNTKVSYRVDYIIMFINGCGRGGFISFCVPPPEPRCVAKDCTAAAGSYQGKRGVDESTFIWRQRTTKSVSGQYQDKDSCNWVENNPSRSRAHLYFSLSRLMPSNSKLSADRTRENWKYDILYCGQYDWYTCIYCYTPLQYHILPCKTVSIYWMRGMYWNDRRRLPRLLANVSHHQRQILFWPISF